MDRIKELMQSGDVKVAAEELKVLLAADPENAEAQMLYGTCCHILGDDETFKKIHDELAPKMENVEDERIRAQWQKFHVNWEYIVIGALVIAATAIGVLYFGRSFLDVFQADQESIKCIAIPDYDHHINQLYAGPPRRYRMEVINNSEL